MPIQTVYAYRDDGLMANWSKWKPRRVECTCSANHADTPGRMFVVKYARENVGSACTISELVCTQLLSELGIQTLKPFIVEVSTGFAASCNFKSDFPYKISAGPHFGTLLETDVVDGPPIAIDDVIKPFDLVLLWVADTWMGNIDRENHGNTLLKLGGGGKYQVIAADQSDCFCGTSQFCARGFLEVFRRQGPAPAPGLLTAAIYLTGGETSLVNAIGKIQQATPNIASILQSVPVEWWNRSGIQPKELAEALYARSVRLTEIINPGMWGVPDGLLV
jgi:hypothetical protein